MVSGIADCFVLGSATKQTGEIAAEMQHQHGERAAGGNPTLNGACFPTPRSLGPTIFCEGGGIR
jgi:hypothetical protein